MWAHPTLKCRNCSVPTAMVLNCKREFVFEKSVLISSLIIQKYSGKAFLRSMRDCVMCFSKVSFYQRGSIKNATETNFKLLNSCWHAAKRCGYWFKYKFSVDTDSIDSNPKHVHYKGWVLNLSTTFWRCPPFWLWILVKTDRISKTLKLVHIAI